MQETKRHKEVPDTSYDQFKNLDAGKKSEAMLLIIYALKNMREGGNTWEVANWLHKKNLVGGYSLDAIHEFIKRRFDDVLKEYGCIGRTGVRRPVKTGNNGFVWYYGVEDKREKVYSKSQKTAADFAEKIIDHAHVPKVQKKIDLEWYFDN